jgi:hypothetical protein
MVYTSFELLSRVGTVAEGTVVVLSALFAAAYGLALWRTPRHHA